MRQRGVGEAEFGTAGSLGLLRWGRARHRICERDKIADRGRAAVCATGTSQICRAEPRVLPMMGRDQGVEIRPVRKE